MSQHLQEKELPELRLIAEELGLEFPKNIGKAKLIEKILAGDVLDDSSSDEVVEGVKTTEDKKPKSTSQIKKEMNILKRIRLSANDPQYKSRNGVTLQVGNKHTVVGKFIPFDIVWHVQVPVYERLKAKRWRETKFVTDPATGSKVPVTRMRPSFVIEDLEPLTEAELKKLASEQAVRGSIPETVNG